MESLGRRGRQVATSPRHPSLEPLAATASRVRRCSERLGVLAPARRPGCAPAGAERLPSLLWSLSRQLPQAPGSGNGVEPGLPRRERHAASRPSHLKPPASQARARSRRNPPFYGALRSSCHPCLALSLVPRRASGGNGFAMLGASRFRTVSPAARIVSPTCFNPSPGKPAATSGLLFTGLCIEARFLRRGSGTANRRCRPPIPPARPWPSTPTGTSPIH